MTEVAQYNELNNEIDRQLDAAREKIQSVFKAVFADFFAKCPEAHALGWTQGTPSWNDGDATEFSVHEVNLYLTEEALDGNDSHQDILKYRSNGNSEAIAAVGGEVRLREILAHFAAVRTFVQKVDDEDMRLIFGDGARITATAQELEIEDYEDDY
ncbi:hypothetical protein G6L37_06555 [Agrobacterium rubi]|nr:hypothetical protein [Agrobacterium rubi]NTF25024.1 hypothetical protein [Agrobacterium rubi]